MPDSVSLTSLRFEPKSIAYLLVAMVVFALLWAAANNVIVPYLQSKVRPVAQLTGGAGGAPSHPAFA